MVESAIRDMGGSLIASLEELEGLHVELLSTIDAKIDYMREANVPGINECVQMERDAVRAIGERECQRRVAVERMGKAFGMASREAKKLTVTQLALRLPEDQGAQLHEVADRIKVIAERVARRNQVAGQLGQGMLEHMDGILSTMRNPGGSSPAYGNEGKSVDHRSQRLFETVG